MRTPTMRLADKPVGAIGVGSFRNSGQELVIQQILTAMQCFDVMPVAKRRFSHADAEFSGGIRYGRAEAANV